MEKIMNKPISSIDDAYYLVYFSMKNKKGKIEDIPLRPFSYEHEAQTYITGYVDAIVNHTGEADEAKLHGQFSIRNAGGQIVNNNEDKSSTNKETNNV